MVKAPTTSSDNIYNSGGKETLFYHVKFTKSLSLMFIVTNERFSTSQLTFLFFTSDLLKTPKPILEQVLLHANNENRHQDYKITNTNSFCLGNPHIQIYFVFSS